MSTQTRLYPYQQDGVDYLVKRGGGFLWDEPGLGKTRQAIVAAKRLGGPVLVACPNALKSWWRKEIKTIYPKDRVITAGVGGRFGTKKHPLKLVSLSSHFPFWVIVHYAGIRINTAEIGGIPWEVVVADECHYVKNRSAQRTQALWTATPPLAFRIGLTATPFGKNPADVWAQLRWMLPTSQGLRSYWRFFNLFVEYTTERVNEFDKNSRAYRKITGGKNLAELAQLMASFGVQRTKQQVAPDLPPITETFLPLVCSGKQAKYYNKLRKAEAEAQIGDVELVIPNTLARLIRLEQLMSHPWSYDEKLTGVKYDWLMEWASAFRHPAVVATHFKSSAHRIARELGCKTAVTGDVPASLRDYIFERWRSGEEQFLVGTIATIGTGLNLQEAHAMVCYDQLYNPIMMEQLKHRIHRINTDHPVEVIYPYVEHTTNEVIMNAFTHRMQQMEFVKLFIAHLCETKEM